MIPYTTIPFLSAFFLVLVGVMIGHLIWYRYRDEKQHEAYQLRSRQHQLKQTLQSQTSEFHDLQQRLSVATEELIQRRSEIDQYEHQTRVWQHERETTAEQLAQERRARRDLAACLTDERNCRSRADDKVQQLVAQLRESESANASRLDERADLERQLESSFQRQQQQAAELQRADEAAKAAVSKLAEQQRSSDQLTLVQHSLSEKLANARQRCLAQQSQSTHLERQLSDRERELSDLTQQVERVERDRAALVQQCDGLEDRLLTATQNETKTDQEMALLRGRLAQLETNQDQLTDELKASETERKQHVARLRTTLTQRDGALVDAKRLRQELNVLRALHADQTQRLEHAEQTERSVSERLAAATANAAQVNQQLLNRTTERELVKKQFSAVSANFEQLSLQLQEKSAQLGQLEQARAVLSQVYQACQAREKKLEQQLAEGAQANAAETQRLRAELVTHRADAEKQRCELTDQLDRFREQTTHELATLRETNASLKMQLKNEGQRRVEQDEELARLESVDDRVIQQDGDLRQLRQEVKDLRQQRHQAVEAESAMRAVVKELREELDERLESIDGLQVDKHDADLRLQQEREQMVELRASKLELQRVVDELQRVISEITPQREEWRTQCAEMSERLSEANAELEQTRRVSAQNERQAMEARHKCAELEAQLETPQTFADRTRHRRFVSLENAIGSESGAAFSFREIRSKQELMTHQDRQKLRRDRRYGSVFEEPPRYPDELTAIPGVTQEFANRLNDLGIYLYRQIMVWDTPNVVAIREALGLDVSIDVDDWIGNARRLYHRDDRSVA